MRRCGGQAVGAGVAQARTSRGTPHGPAGHAAGCSGVDHGAAATAAAAARPRQTTRDASGDRARRSASRRPRRGLSRTSHQPAGGRGVGGPLHRQRAVGEPDHDESPGARHGAVPDQQPVAVVQRRLASTGPGRTASPTTPDAAGTTRLSWSPARGVVSQAVTISDPRSDDREDQRCSRDLFAPTIEVSAHCDLPVRRLRPAQARIEAESIKAIIAKVADNDDPDFRTRAILIKEQRSELVKHHLWVLWTDYFKPPHFEKYPQLHTLVNEATKLAGATGTKGAHGRRQGRRAARQDRRDRRDLLGDQEGLSGARLDVALRDQAAAGRGAALPGPEPRLRLCAAISPRPTGTAKVRTDQLLGPRPQDRPPAPTSRCACRPTAPTSPCCARRPPASPPGSTSPSTTSRTCGSRSARPARWCCPRPRPRSRPGVPRSSCGPGSSTVSVSRRRASAPRQPDYDSFAWQVLTTLADHALTADADGDQLTVTLTVRLEHRRTPWSDDEPADTTPSHGPSGPRDRRGDPTRSAELFVVLARRRAPPRRARSQARDEPGARCTCRWSSTARAGSATAASRSRTWSRSARSG